MERTVLVADDDPMATTVLSAVLGDRGFQVALAPDRDEARRLLRASPPDVVVLGASPTGRDEELAGLAADASAAQVPVVVLTGADQHVAAHAPLSAGVRARLGRPCSPLHLVEVLETVVDERPGAASPSTS